MKKKILIVEDDTNIAELLKLHLIDEGFDVSHTADGVDASFLLENHSWDCLIFDIMLPGIDGLELCRLARKLPNYIPVVIISARCSEVHRILGLELGADDYLTKPFSIFELIARIKALFRRQLAMNQAFTAGAGMLTSGPILMDLISREVKINNNVIDLTPLEFDLLHYFLKQPNIVFSRMDLLVAVWGYTNKGYEHTVNTHINRLRHKIETHPNRPQLIKTVWGHGYKYTGQ